jgi:predicted Zn-dependent peptidase
MQIPIERFSLDNGLRVIFSEDHTIPVVAVNLWYNVGSRNEQPGKTGLAHLFEHMMFQGSENVPGTEHIALVERVGGSVNGSTWLDRTNYYETVPSSHLELALWLEADRMGNFVGAITQEKLDTQREVVKNERRQRVDNAPYGDWDERIQMLLFPPDHPYHHSVIGSMDDLDGASLEDVRDFFRTYYAPNNAVLAIVGDFDPAQARAMVDRWFAPIPRGPAVPPIPGRPEIPHRLGTHLRERVESEVALGRVYLGHRIPPYGSDTYYAADVAAELLAGGKSGRLYHSLVRERRLAQGVGAFTFPTVTGAAVFAVRGNCAPETSVETMEAALLGELQRLRAEAPSEEELERALTAIEARQVMALQKPSERADQLAMFETHFGHPELVETEIERYRAVTAEGVRRFALEYLGDDNRAVLSYVPRPKEAA